jgi:hypothetical protein
MDDFLGRLARRQVEANTGLTPRLLPRFGATQAIETDDHFLGRPLVASTPDASDREVNSAGRGEPLDREPTASMQPATAREAAHGSGPGVERPDRDAPDQRMAVDALPRPVASSTTTAPARPSPAPARREVTAEAVEASHVLGTPIVAVPAARTGQAADRAWQPRTDLLVPTPRSAPPQPSIPAGLPRRSERLGPPVVKLSIERVEVRVVTARTNIAPAPVGRNSRKPALSLEDYLARRHGAVRR